MNPNAAKQAAYRARQSEKLGQLLAASIRMEAMETALRLIADELADTKTTKGLKVRQIAMEALK